MHLSHREYYRDRLTEDELCQDFPGDEILIDGLYSMQAHFDNNGVNITIPVVRVMNTVHFIAAYMFSTECSGDPMEYEVMASMSCGRDKQLAIVSMIVLAALLKRTEGFRAQQCRNLILDNRDPDFEEGVTLYDRFLHSAEKRFAEEDFLIDTHAQIQQLQTENTRLTSENIKLKYTITTMENQQNNQYNYQYHNCVIYNAPVYNTSTANNYYQQPAPVAEDVEPEPSSSVSPESDSGSEYFPYITKKCFQEKRVDAVEAEIQAARKGKAEDMWRTLWNNENLGYVEVEHINATTLYRDIEKWYGKLPYTERNFRGARHKR